MMQFTLHFKFMFYSKNKLRHFTLIAILFSIVYYSPLNQADDGNSQLNGSESVQATITKTPNKPVDKPTLMVLPTRLATNLQSLDRYKFDVNDLTRRIEESLQQTFLFRIYRSREDLVQWFYNSDKLNAFPSRIDTHNSSSISAQSKQGNITEHKIQYFVEPLITAFDLKPSYANISGLPGKYKRTDYAKIIMVVEVSVMPFQRVVYKTTMIAQVSTNPRVVTNKKGKASLGLWHKLVTKLLPKEAMFVLINDIMPIAVSKVDGDSLYLNRGNHSGVHKGQKWNIYNQGEELLDPVSGDYLGRTEKLVGRVEIITIRPRFSIARLISRIPNTPLVNAILRKD